MVAIDGTTGEVVVEPTDEALERWRQRAAESRGRPLRALDELRDRPAVTADGVRIRLEANLEIADEVGRVRDAGAEGIGLYRSEFLLDARAAGRGRPRTRRSRPIARCSRRCGRCR